MRSTAWRLFAVPVVVAGALCALGSLGAAEASAQGSLAPGSRVQASPTQMDGHWQDCVVVSGPDQHGSYRVKCGGSDLFVPSRWIRSAPAASTKPGSGLSASGSSRGAIAAPRPTAPPPPRNEAAGSVALGSYECWAFNTSRMNLNFQVTGAGSYRASDGSSGRFRFDPASQRITFTGYLGEAMPDGFTSIYHEPNGHPTVSFRGRGGAEASFCEKK